MNLEPLTEMVVVVSANLAAAWALDYLLHSTLFIAMAGLIARCHWATSADLAFVWRTAIVLPPFTALAHLVVAPTLSLGSEEAVALAATLGSDLPLALWILGAATILATTFATIWLIVRWGTLRALGRRAEPRFVDAALVRVVARRMGVRDPRVSVSPALSVPAATAGEVWLPEDLFEALDPYEREAVIAHELAHVLRRDPFWIGAARLVASTLWFQPLNRFALRAFRTAAEEAADDLALAHLADPRALARALGSLAPLVARHESIVVSAASGSLIARVQRMLKADCIRAPRVRRPLLVAVATASIALSVLGGVHVDPDAAANAIPWLAPSTDLPNERMLELRSFLRGRP